MDYRDQGSSWLPLYFLSPLLFYLKVDCIKPLGRQVTLHCHRGIILKISLQLDQAMTLTLQQLPLFALAKLVK